MKKIIIRHGLLAGLIVSGMLVATQPLLRAGLINYDKGMLVGYTTMVIALSMVFIGIKRYRDQDLDGVISFGKAVKIGILISLIASFMYAITWEIYYAVAGEGFIEEYTQYHLDKLKREGASEAAVKEEQTKMAAFNQYYQNPFFRFAFSLFEIIPVGILITLISAALLRKKHAGSLPH